MLFEMLPVRHVWSDSDRPVCTLPGLSEPAQRLPAASRFSMLTKAAHFAEMNSNTKHVQAENANLPGMYVSMGRLVCTAPNTVSCQR